jgi:hypothetical protein
MYSPEQTTNKQRKRHENRDKHREILSRNSLAAKDYWQDHDRSPREYLEKGVVRIDWVHTPEDPRQARHWREKIIIHRLLLLREAGIPIYHIFRDLDENTEEVRGKLIVVGGSIEDVCCEKRARFLYEAGAHVVLDLSLTTNF